ncbi:RING-H2 finger protein ATL33-like isoform X3 [Nymphaea colorata]|uniref:RING-H2 finger protein ATL33-like isoform X3 n=1 Tax=Nymphaea colorata TaxID=210225 RepID=UPI00214EE8F8|nr:RING-H2 finger protein ATL33-like isoform X3 [Nymphaea colorata]
MRKNGLRVEKQLIACFPLTSQSGASWTGLTASATEVKFMDRLPCDHIMNVLWVVSSKGRWNGMFSWGRGAMSGSGSTTNRRSEPTVTVCSAANNGFCLTAVSDRLSSDREVCPVCLDVFHLHQTVMHLPCLHRYHPECLRPWLSAHSDCPYCRTHVSVRSLVG